MKEEENGDKKAGKIRQVAILVGGSWELWRELNLNLEGNERYF
jgi:hypothetical protein